MPGVNCFNLLNQFSTREKVIEDIFGTGEKIILELHLGKEFEVVSIRKRVRETFVHTV